MDAGKMPNNRGNLELGFPLLIAGNSRGHLFRNFPTRISESTAAMPHGTVLEGPVM